MKENQLLKTLKQAKLKLLVVVGSLGWNWSDAAAEAGCKGQMESESFFITYFVWDNQTYFSKLKNFIMKEN